MKQKYIHALYLGAIFTAAVATWTAPKIITVLFTPPVSFGVNCEPAASWSMHQLVVSQVIGLIVGAILGVLGAKALFERKEKKLDTGVAER